MSTTLTEAREAVYKKFVDTWGTRTVFQLENELFEEPGPDTAWVRVSVNHLDQGGQETLGPKGSRKYRRLASAFVQIFTPVNAGMQAADGHIEVVKTMFEGESFDGLDFNDTLVRENGPTEDRLWNQVTTESQFAYEEVK